MTAPETPLAYALGQLYHTPVGSETNAILAGLAPGVVAATGLGTNELWARTAERFGMQRVPEMGFGEGFLKSTLWSAGPEMIGMQPDAEIEQWRLQNPKMALLSHLVGGIPTFAFPGPRLAGAVARGVGPLAKAFAVADDWQRAGKIFKAGALRETATFAPIFTTQAVGSILAPQEGTVGRTAQTLAIEIPAVGVFGGLGNVFANRGVGASYPAARRGGKNDIAGTEAQVSEVIDYPLNQPLQVKHRALADMLERAGKSPEVAAQLEPVRAHVDRLKLMLESEIRTETLSGQAVRRVRQGMGLTNRLNGLYSGKASGLETKRFLLRTKERPDGFATPEELAAVNPDGLMFHNWESFVQAPRLLETTSQAGNAKIHQALREMVQVGDGVWLAEEGAEGAYVGLKSIPGQRVPGKGGLLGLPTYTRDRWLLFKTNAPHKFVEGGGGLEKRMAEVFLRKNFHQRVDPKVPQESTPTLNVAENTEKILRPWMQAVHATPKAIDENGFIVTRTPLGRLLDSILPQAEVEARHGAVATMKGLGRTVQGGMSPAIHEFSGNPRAAAMHSQVSMMVDNMTKRVKEILYGKAVDSERIMQKGLLRGGLFTTKKKHEGGVMQLIDDFTQADLDDFTKIRIGMLSPEEAYRRGFTPGSVNLARRLLRDVDQPFTSEYAAQTKALGLDAKLVPKEFHYHLSQSYVGEFRLPIYDITGAVKGYGSGFSQQQAVENAVDIIQTINAESPSPLLLTYDVMKTGKFKEPTIIRQGGRVEKVKEVSLYDNEVLRVEDEIFTASSIDPRFRNAQRDMNESDIFQLAVQLDPDDALVRRIVSTRAKLFDQDPGRFFKSKGMLGTAGSSRSFTKSELKERIASNVQESQRLLTRQALQSVMQPEMSRLASEDWTAYNRLVARINSHMGLQGPVAKFVDIQLDKIGAPIFGPRAASKAIRHMNQALFFLTLGAGDIGFATLNAMTPLQTVLPEIAFTLRTPPRELSGFYSVALFDAGEQGVRAVNFLDPIKIMGLTFKDLSASADDVTKRELIRARADNIITRQGVEAYMGADINEVGRLGKVFTGGESLIDWTKALSATPVALSEEFARSFAFAAGRRLYLNFMAPSRLSGQALQDAAYEFARRFTLRTNYGYGTADRPRILTGAIGTGWGLFRNWTFNYLHNLATYTNAGFARNNWAPLIYSMLGTGAVGGIAAMPFYGMMDGFTRMATNKSLETQMYELTGGNPHSAYVADTLMYGPLAALGVTLQARASVPGTEFLRDASMMSNMLLMDRGKALANTLGLAYQNASIGQNPYNDDRFVRELMRTFAPRTLQHAWQVWDGNLTSLKTGNVLTSDVGRFGAIATAFGFQSTDVRKLFAVSDELYKDQQAKREAIQMYGSLLDQVWGPGGTAKDIRGVLWRAYEAGVPIESVIRSAQSREQKRRGDYLERQFDDYKIMQMRRVRGLGY